MIHFYIDSENNASNDLIHYSTTLIELDIRIVLLVNYKNESCTNWIKKNIRIFEKLKDNIDAKELYSSGKNALDYALMDKLLKDINKNIIDIKKDDIHIISNDKDFDSFIKNTNITYGIEINRRNNVTKAISCYKDKLIGFQEIQSKNYESYTMNVIKLIQEQKRKEREGILY